MVEYVLVQSSVLGFAPLRPHALILMLFDTPFSGFYDNYYGYTTTPEEQEDEELAELINPREGFSEPIAMPVIYSPGVTAADVYGLNRGGGYRRKRSNKRVKNFR